MALLGGIAVEDLAMMNEYKLRDTFHRIHHWKTNTDPNAKHLPRFKQRDDKTIVAVRFL